MAIAKYAHVLTTSTSNDLQSNDANIFDEDNYSSFTKKAESNGITYDSSTGEFTVDEDGTYFVIVTVQASLTSIIAFDSIRCRVKLNGTEVEAGIFDFRETYGVTESTFQTLVAATSGQKITITLHDPHSSNHGLKAEKFSSVLIFKTEAGFGRIARTSASNNSAAPYNAYATSSGGATVTNFSTDGTFFEKPSAGAGAMGFSSDVNALLFFNNYLGGDGGSPPVFLTYRIDNTPFNYTTGKPAPSQPVEATIMSANSFSANSSGTLEFDANGVSFNVTCNTSSSITAIGMPSNVDYIWRKTENHGDTESAGAEFNVFATANYSGAGYSITGSESGITFTSGSGLVTLGKDGAYAIFTNFYGLVGGDSDFMYKIKHNSSVADNIFFHMDASQDPADRSVVTVITGAVAGDTIQFFASGTNNSLEARKGAGFVIMQLAAASSTPTVCADGLPLFNRDPTVFNPYNNCNQYTLETITQPPFILGARGYGITRKNDTALVVDPGAKSNPDD